MNTHPDASKDQLLQLAGMVSQNLPRDLPSDIAQEWIGEPKSLRKFLTALREGPCPLSQVKLVVIGVSVRKEGAKKPLKIKLVAFNLGCATGLNKALRIRERLGLGAIDPTHETAFAKQKPKVVQKLIKVVSLDDSHVITWKANAYFPADTWFLGLRK